VQGTPTDCVIMGVKRLFADQPPDLILSGVNRGQNAAELGHDRFEHLEAVGVHAVVVGDENSHERPFRPRPQRPF
jgi:hypothetical protein